MITSKGFACFFVLRFVFDFFIKKNIGIIAKEDEKCCGGSPIGGVMVCCGKA